MPKKPAMAIRNFAKYIAAALAAVACTVQEPLDTQAPKTSEPASSDAPFISGVLTLEFDDAMTALVESREGLDTKSAALNNVMEELGIESMERVFPYAGEYEARTRKSGLHRFYRVRFSRTQPVTKAMADFRAVPGVVSATPGRKISRRGFNDPYLSRQWHLVNSSGADINVKPVWENYTVGSSDVIVAVVDEAIALNHQDLKGNLWDDGQGHHGYNPFYDNYDIKWWGGSSTYASGHGTHVAGVISAVNNNGTGISSVAGGDAAQGIKGVQLMSCQIYLTTAAENKAYYSKLGDDDEDLSAPNAIKWSADHGAVISQNSWGYEADGCTGSNPNGKVDKDELAAFKSFTLDDLPALKAALQYFIDYAGCDKEGNQRADSPMKGGLVFFAAGNEGHLNVDYDPICCSNREIISVGAFDKDGSRSYFSQYGSWVDVAAPGGGYSGCVWSTVPTEINSTGYEGDDWMGTSMACPHASGVAALIVSYYGGAGFTNADARKILFDGLGSTIGTTSKPAGRKLDAGKSFEIAGTIEETPLVLRPKSVALHAHETREYTLKVNSSSSSPSVECTPGSSALTYDSATGLVTIVGRNADPGTYKATFTLHQSPADDYSLDFQYTIMPNHAPRVNLGSYKFNNTSVSSLSVTLSKNKPSSLSSLFEDEDGEILDVQLSVSNPEVVSVKEYPAILEIKPLGYGYSKVFITATDGLGEQATISFAVVVKDPEKAGSAEAFPAAAQTEVNLWPVGETVQKFDIKVYSGSGAKVAQTIATGSVFQPITLDVSAYAPGVYSAWMTATDGSLQKVFFVKI